jgi:hypothetical protein
MRSRRKLLKLRVGHAVRERLGGFKGCDEIPRLPNTSVGTRTLFSMGRTSMVDSACQSIRAIVGLAEAR